jgi:hypothetical protein
VTRSVIRHVTWTIATDLSEGASPPLYEMECTTCPERSPAGEVAADAQQWALEHSGRHPTHTGFRGINTSFWRTSMVGGSRTS